MNPIDPIVDVYTVMARLVYTNPFVAAILICIVITIAKVINHHQNTH